ncbi:MAG TPA: NUDIX domain-containing protein [Streptosporangiaceae bacterium]|jgi:ADP-ribose pyrophosphatase YjhB (NUDIX family)|nr:NUDIX domain-containing protein [Streptosporangiaceae bacterium]
MTARRIPCVGAIVRDDAGRLLLVQRGHDPEAGRWSLPGGRVEPGETDAEALAREMHEETGLIVTAGPLVGAVERPGRAGTVLDIRDYEATVTGGQLAAGDDAAAARWVAAADVTALPLTTGLAEALRAWGVLDPE